MRRQLMSKKLVLRAILNITSTQHQDSLKLKYLLILPQSLATRREYGFWSEEDK